MTFRQSRTLLPLIIGLISVQQVTKRILASDNKSLLPGQGNSACAFHPVRGKGHLHGTARQKVKLQGLEGIGPVLFAERFR
jgi:hypothetical protein